MTNTYLFQTRNFAYSEVTYGNTTFKLKKRQRKIEFDVFVICFIFFIPLSQIISLIKINCTCYFYMHQNSGACAGMYTFDCTHQIKNAIVSQRKRNSLSCFNAKVQINNAKMESFFFHLPVCLHLF